MTRKRRVSRQPGQNRLRLLQCKRQYAKESRLRLKTHILDLEAQAKCLASEASRLKSLVHRNEEVGFPSPLAPIGVRLLQEYREILANQQVSDEEIEEFLDDTIGKMGVGGPYV